MLCNTVVRLVNLLMNPTVKGGILSSILFPHEKMFFHEVLQRLVDADFKPVKAGLDLHWNGFRGPPLFWWTFQFLDIDVDLE